MPGVYNVALQHLLDKIMEKHTLQHAEKENAVRKMKMCVRWSAE